MPRLTPEHKVSRTAEMREAICRTFTELVAAQGDTSMEHLAETMGIAKGTIYNYFRDKSELTAEVIRIRALEMLENICRNRDKNAPADRQLMTCVRIMMEDFIAYRYLRIEYLKSHPIGKNQPPSRVLAVFAEIIAQGIEEKTFRSSDPEEAALFVFCSLVGKFRYTLRNGLNFDIDKELELFSAFALRALK